MKGREMFRQMWAKQPNTQTQAGQPKKRLVERLVQADARCPSNKKQFMQQRQQRQRQRFVAFCKEPQKKNKYNNVPAISSQLVSHGLSTHRASNILGRTGYHV